jgi:hypothetical protein
MEKAFMLGSIASDFSVEDAPAPIWPKADSLIVMMCLFPQLCIIVALHTLKKRHLNVDNYRMNVKYRVPGAQ